MAIEITRRAAIRNLLIIAGGTMVLPACYRQSGSTTIALTHFTISEADEQVLAALGETLIPATDTPGSRELLLHLFVLKMVDDCHSPEDQRAFVQGLANFAKWADGKLGIAFQKASADEREALLRTIQDDHAMDETLSQFYALTKRRTIQGYLNSKYVMTNLVKYQLIPGPYNGYAQA